MFFCDSPQLTKRHCFLEKEQLQAKIISNEYDILYLLKFCKIHIVPVANGTVGVSLFGPIN
jgi:hypothetical protein